MAIQPIDTTTDNGAYRGDPARVAFTKVNDNTAYLDGRLALVESSQGSNQIAFESWANMSSVAGTIVGQMAQVIGDAGSHVDPVSGQTVANNGQYRWTGTVWQWLRADVLAGKADIASVNTVRLDTGSPEVLVPSSIGSTSATGQISTVGYVLANAVPLPYRAVISKVAVTVPSAFSGEIHVLSPHATGGTRTAAIFPISRPVAGTGEITLDFIAEAGSYVAYKQVTGSNLRYRVAGAGESVPGSARWLSADTVSVGDVQGFPVIGATAELALRVEYQSTGRESLDVAVKDAASRADVAGAQAKKASDFLGIEGVGYDVAVIGSVSRTYNNNANALYGYGPADPSPGGSVHKVSAVFSGVGTAIIEAIGPDRIIIARHAVAFVNGTNEWIAGTGFPSFDVPAGGYVYIRALSGNNVRYVSGSGARAFSTAGFAQATEVGQTQEWGITDVYVAVRIEYEVLALRLADVVGQKFSPSLFDEDFSNPLGWTFAGGAVAGGVLVSGDSASWANACVPAFYGRTQLMRRTLTAYAEVVSANQVWGLGFIRDSVGTTLDTPLALVDGRTNQLFVYKWNGTSEPTGGDAGAQVLPWDVVGSRMRIDIERQWFSTTISVTNLVTGQSVQRVLDYTIGTGADTGRPWGRPCVVFPSTTAGGVLIKRMRMVADFPYPSAQAARVLLIGDSITEGSVIGGSPYPEHNKVWSHLVEDDRLAMGARDVAVMARGGQISSHAVNAMHEAAGLCDGNTVVVILLGTNDVLTNSTRDAWRANMTAIVSALRARTSRISLACLPPINTAGTPLRNQLNEDILAKYFGQDLMAPVRFDLALSANSDGVTWGAGMHSGDSIHPSVLGNAAMLARLRLDVPEAFE